MKKKKLYKLIKEQLKVTLLEELFKKRTKKRNAKLWDKKWNNFINEQKIIKKQQDKEHFLKIARFLKESKKSKILLEEIIENPLLSNINKKKLPKLYKSLNSLSFSKLVEQIRSDEFEAPELTIWGGNGTLQWSGCNMTQTDFGVAVIYDNSAGGCSSTPHTINDSFVCCSDNNTYAQDWSGYGIVDPFQLGTQPSFVGFSANNTGATTNYNPSPPPGAQSACYCPNPVVDTNDNLTSCFTPTTGYNITVADFGNFLTNFGISNINLNAFGGFNGASCAGCSHMASPAVAGTTPNYGKNPWNNALAGGTGGCPTDGSTSAATWNGQMSPDELSCCAFYGCDQSGASPQPTALATFTLTAGSLGTITANNSDSWFYDNSPGVPCEFLGCPGYTVPFTLGGASYSYSTNQTPISGITNTNNSYTITNTTPTTCVMTACSDPNIDGLTDPLGTALATNYIASTTNYTVTNDVTECVIEACTTPGSVNTVDTTNWNASWTIVDTTPSMCDAIVSGCTNSTQGAPNYTDTTGTCPDGTTGTAGTAGECANATGGGYVAQNYNPAANQDTTPTSCTYDASVINGCTNPLATNYFCDDPAATGTYACTGTNSDILPVDATGAQLVVDTSPTMCTYTAGCTDDGGRGATYTHNQFSATFPALLPSSLTSSPYGVNVATGNVEPALNFSIPALLGGELNDIAIPTGVGNGNTSCTYNPGCTDDSFTEYYSTTPPAIHDDGTCDEPIITGSQGNLGCMLGQVINTLTTNYYSGAVLDDGSCDVEACEKPAADNYVCKLVDSVDVEDYCTGGPTGTLNILPIANPGQVPINPLSVNSFTPLGDYDPVTNNVAGACLYTITGCTIPGAENYDTPAGANVDDGSCYFKYCPDSTTPAFNYNINQPIATSGPNNGLTISFTSNANNTPDTEKCEYIGCGQETIGNPLITATVGNLGQDDGYYSGNDGCVATIAAGLTTIPSTIAVGWQTTGLLDPLNTDCCEFLGCYNAGNPDYNQVVGGITTTAVPLGYNPDANVDDGSCKYNGCTDPNASNYFCIANPDVCGGSQGGTPDPGIGMVADDGTCEYNHCADIQAIKCGNPYSQSGGGQQMVYDFDCITIDGSLPALGTNDRFLLPNTPPDTPPTIGPVVSEQINKMVDIPNPGSTCYEVVVINPSNSGNQTDYPSCVCPDPTFPPTYDCCTYATCPGTFQLHYGPGSAWAIANPGMSTPSIDPNFKFCQERLDGTGQFPTLADCNADCGDEYYNCSCCRKDTGQPQSPSQQVNQTVGGCSTLNSTIYSNCQPASQTNPSIVDICREIEVFGCTDPLASNYNQYATQDDGSCVYEGADCQCCVFVEKTITLSPITITSWCIGYYGYPFSNSTSPPCPYVLGQQVTSQGFEHQDFSANPTCEDNNTVTPGSSPYSVGDITMCTQHPSQGGWTWDCSNDIIVGLPKIKPTDGEIGIDKVEPKDLDEPTTSKPNNDLEDNSDTPEIRESKKLRKLIKKWRKNNL